MTNYKISYLYNFSKGIVFIILYHIIKEHILVASSH